MLAKDLINRLERLGLLDQEIIEALREQLAQSGARVTPEAVAKLLVDNGQLTRFQATKLIGELRSSEYPDTEDDVEVVDEAGDDMALLDGEDSSGFVVEVVDEIAEAVEVIDYDQTVPVRTSGRQSIANPHSDLMSMDDQSGALSPRRRKVNSPKKVEGPEKSVWDSFKIYGIASIIMVLVFLGGTLYFVLNKGGADEFISAANNQYDQRSHAAAQASYEAFLSKYGESNPHSSIARTRAAMCKLYLASQFTNPVQVIDESERILPQIEAEVGLDEERNNLAALLVDIADNIAKAAGDAKTTEDKQRLLKELDRQIKLTENPTYVTSATRQSLSSRLLTVVETRARVQRDINRNLRLDESVLSMDADLKEQKTKAAYDTRMQLLREFPELRIDKRIVELVKSASVIQQKLVKPATDLPTVSKEALATDSIKKIVLTSLTGEAAPSLNDEVVYIRVHGSILAFNAASGKLQWRRYVGYGQDHAPVPVNPGGQAGVLLSDSQSLEVQNTESKDGAIRWRTKIGESFSQPIASEGVIYVSTQSGRLIAIEADTGQPRWASLLPQPLEESPGTNERPGKLYITGDHSNLYVIDKKSGNCGESFYIGHAKGTVSVPPISLQGENAGHVFVFENAGVNYTLMHVLKCDKQGGELKVTQPPFRLDGNVTVPPVLVLGRRMIVITDLGQVAVYDIEQTAKVEEQVSKVAEQVASYDAPTSTQMAVGKNQMWVTGSRIRRFELQVSTGRVVPGWLNHEGDAFIGSPFLVGGTLIHARVLRGSTGVRVTACNPENGTAFWQTDVGVPLAMLVMKKDGKGFHAITSQATLFELDGRAISEGATTGPIENPGGSGVAKRFEKPLRIDDQRAVLLNQESGGQICVYDPTREREKLRLITLALPAGSFCKDGIIAGDGLMLPLDTGRIMLLDWQTGSSLGSPFQPASEPGKTVLWTQAVSLTSDPSQVVIGDDRKKLWRVRVAEQVRELGSVDLGEPLLGSIAVINDTIVASVAGPAADFIVCFDGTSLAESARTLLDGRIAWGPFSVGKSVVVQTNDGLLRGFDAAGKPMMQPLPLPPGQLVPGVKIIGDKLIVAGKSGWLVAVEVSSGKLVGKTDLGQPLSGLPIEAGKRFLVPGAEGVVYISDIPSTRDTP